MIAGGISYGIMLWIPTVPDAKSQKKKEDNVMAEMGHSDPKSAHCKLRRHSQRNQINDQNGPNEMSELKCQERSLQTMSCTWLLLILDLSQNRLVFR